MMYKLSPAPACIPPTLNGFFVPLLTRCGPYPYSPDIHQSLAIRIRSMQWQYSEGPWLVALESAFLEKCKTCRLRRGGFHRQCWIVLFSPSLVLSQAMSGKTYYNFWCIICRFVRFRLSDQDNFSFRSMCIWRRHISIFCSGVVPFVQPCTVELLAGLFTSFNNHPKRKRYLFRVICRIIEYKCLSGSHICQRLCSNFEILFKAAIAITSDHQNHRTCGIKDICHLHCFVMINGKESV